MSDAARSTARRWVERVAFLGVDPADPDELRLQKVTLTLAAVTVSVLAIIWVGTYLALGLPVSAAIPFAYQIVSRYEFEERGGIEIKGKGRLKAYLLVGRRDEGASAAASLG